MDNRLCDFIPNKNLLDFSFTISSKPSFYTPQDFTSFYNMNNVIKETDIKSKVIKRNRKTLYKNRLISSIRKKNKKHLTFINNKSIIHTSEVNTMTYKECEKLYYKYLDLREKEYDKWLKSTGSERLIASQNYNDLVDKVHFYENKMQELKKAEDIQDTTYIEKIEKLEAFKKDMQENIPATIETLMYKINSIEKRCQFCKHNKTNIFIKIYNFIFRKTKKIGSCNDLYKY